MHKRIETPSTRPFAARLLFMLFDDAYREKMGNAIASADVAQIESQATDLLTRQLPNQFRRAARHRRAAVDAAGFQIARMHKRLDELHMAELESLEDASPLSLSFSDLGRIAACVESLDQCNRVILALNSSPVDA
jgi:hypothetical protein